MLSSLCTAWDHQSRSQGGIRWTPTEILQRGASSTQKVTSLCVWSQVPCWEEGPRTRGAEPSSQHPAVRSSLTSSPGTCRLMTVRGWLHHANRTRSCPHQGLFRPHRDNPDEEGEVYRNLDILSAAKEQKEDAYSL